MHSTRTRALAVLLSSQGRTIIEIATLLMVDEDTARCWINRWFIGKRENLEDEYRVGGPATRNAEEQAATIEMIKEHPSEPKVVINKINDQFGKTISRDTLRRDTAGATHPRTVVIPMGPYPVTDGEAAKSDLRQELVIPEHVKVFLSFGHIRDGKCLDVVLEAMVRCPD
jgi:transposase